MEFCYMESLYDCCIVITHYVNVSFVKVILPLLDVVHFSRRLSSTVYFGTNHFKLFLVENINSDVVLS